MIAWEETGTGVPLVLVHGITEDRRSWDAVVPHLDDFRCIRLDLRGHGESSDASDYSALAMADDVATVVAEAGIDAPPLVVGHSLGAVVATAYAAQAPTRAVVNIDQSLRFGEFGAAVQSIGDALRADFDSVFPQVIGGVSDAGLPDDAVAYVTEQRRVARREVVLGVWSLVLDTPPDELTALAEGLLGSIRVPYLAIHGADPGPEYAAWLRGLVPSATVEAFDVGGHYPHLAEPERFAARVRAFAGAAR